MINRLRFLVLVNLFCPLLGCHRDVEPAEKAALVAVQDFTKCGGCGGWVVNVDNGSFRAELPAQFTKPSTPVWLRYEKDESSEVKKAGNWISILSIRERSP